MRDHTKLKAFELADALVLRVYAATCLFPRHELFGLTSQMRRAAVSIPCNIVEGCARPNEAEFLRFLDIAYGSSRELEYQVSLARRLNYLDNSQFSDLEPSCVEVSKVVNGLIRAIRK